MREEPKKPIEFLENILNTYLLTNREIVTEYSIEVKQYETLKEDTIYLKVTLKNGGKHGR